MDDDRNRDWFPPAIERFVEQVERGTPLKTTEFAGAVSVTVSNTLRDAGTCRYDSGGIVEAGQMIILLFHCRTDLIEQGIAAYLEWDGNSVQRVDLTAHEITPDPEDFQ